MQDFFDLGGRIAFITGSARGLGREMARGLGKAGAEVYLNGSNAERAEAAAQQLRNEGLNVYASAFDVSDEVKAKSALDTIFGNHGRFDILINNVGQRFRQLLENIESDKLRELLNVNLVSAYALSKYAAVLMSRGNYGRIINISSVASEKANAGDCAYLIAKGGMNAMTRALAAEFGPSAITCNAILPGPFRTETNDKAFSAPGMDDFFRNRILLQRAGHPSEIGGAAVFLASPGAAFVTGVSLPVDGGYMVAG